MKNLQLTKKITPPYGMLDGASVQLCNYWTDNTEHISSFKRSVL